MTLNLSSFILFKIAFRKEKSEKHSYRKSSWVLQVSKYDSVKFFPGTF